MIKYFTINTAICYITKCYLNFGQILLVMYIGTCTLVHVHPYAESTVFVPISGDMCTSKTSTFQKVYCDQVLWLLSVIFCRPHTSVCFEVSLISEEFGLTYYLK